MLYSVAWRPFVFDRTIREMDQRFYHPYFDLTFGTFGLQIASGQK
ncbi:MAG: hypothetical protein AAGA86_11305 [Bacteroidota bacterium]